MGDVVSCSVDLLVTFHMYSSQAKKSLKCHPGNESNAAKIARSHVGCQALQDRSI